MAVASIDRRTINRGETLGFCFALSRKENPDSVSLECEITVLGKRGGVDLITPRSIDQDGFGQFIGILSEAETDLSPGEYFLIATITGTDIRRELQQRFTVREAW